MSELSESIETAQAEPAARTPFEKAGQPGILRKLVIQVPCFNEAKTLPQTLADLPRQIKGFEMVEVLVIDDGSTDGTAQVAETNGADHVVRLPRNRGLAYAFATGLETALQLGADVIVNTDADNQYRGADIPRILRPILEGSAEFVVGDRQIDTIRHFSRTKRWLQKMGSRVVRWASGTDIPDATSGFRAMTRDAAMQLVIYSDYTYTLETIIQAGKKGISITHVPIQTNEKLRESRLITSLPAYIWRSGVTILRIFLMYESLRVFVMLGLAFGSLGALISFRFLYFFIIGEGQGHIQSLILAAVLLIFGFQAFLLALLADVIAKNRYLDEEINYRLKRARFER